MIKLLFYNLLAYAGEGTGHSHDHGIDISSSQILGFAIIAVISIGVMYFIGKKMN